MTTDITPRPATENLHLVDFANAQPETLAEQVTNAIEQGQTFLQNLSDTPASSEQALQDIIDFDHLGRGLDRAWGILSHLNSVMSNDETRDAHHATLPKLSAYSTEVGQHKPLYARYKAVENDAEFFSSLSPARQRAITLAVQGFELAGIGLPTDEQAKFADIQSQLSTLSAKFADNVLDATTAYALPLTNEQLAGITDTGLAMLHQAGEQFKSQQVEQSKLKQAEVDALPTPYPVATLDIPVYLAIMTHAEDRALRQTLYTAYVTRASELSEQKNKDGKPLDNGDIMSQILALREQKAQLLGFTNFAELSLSKKMADNVDTVETFLLELADKATPFAQADLKQLQDMATTLGMDTVQAGDTAYLAEKVKQNKFSLSQEDIRPYFPLPKVIDGLFAIVKKLFDITAVEIAEQDLSASVWQDDVRFYQLYDGEVADDNLLGGFYFDLYARTGKRGGAWMSGFQSRYTHASGDEQSHILPVCFMVGNFTPPNHTEAEDKPSLLTHNEVLTLFHEFGHGLHHLLTTVDIGDVAGVNGVEWDAVELPSQFLENWAWDSEGIALISGHVETGETLPQDKLDALLSAKNFQSGMQTLRQIEFALFDLRIHAKSPAPDYQGILAMLDEVRNGIAIMDTPESNRFANGFSHIFAGGYASGYYSYKWAELLSADAFGKFEEDGVFNADTGKAFRENILAVGGSLPAKVNFETFRGREATIDALLRHSGFVDADPVFDSNTGEVA